MAPPPSPLVRGLSIASCLALAVYFTSGVPAGAAQWFAAPMATVHSAVGAHTTPGMGGPVHLRNRMGLSLPNQVAGSDAAPQVVLQHTLPNTNAVFGAIAAAGTIVGGGLMLLFQRITKPSDQEPEEWSIAAVDLLQAPEAEAETAPTAAPLPQLAGNKPFRPDLFQPRGEVKTVPLTDGVPWVQTRNFFFNRKYTKKDIMFASILALMHGLAFTLGPATYRPDCLALMLGLYAITGLGITFSYHRQLSHKAFTTPKWLEYLMAYAGAQSLQGPPQHWVATHRYHHMYCETDRDPHTISEGIWWSHMGWLLDSEATKARVGDRSIAADIVADPFYAFLEKTYILHPILMACALYAWGGVPYLIWGMAVRIVWVWHVTWAVNGASHSWGPKKYKTNPVDESRNNWWVGLIALGEGWHNNHHAFQYSARLGFEWWQVDITWYVICLLRVLGLASNIKLPSEAKKQALLLT
eukprot:EG_transcript_11539